MIVDWTWTQKIHKNKFYNDFLLDEKMKFSTREFSSREFSTREFKIKIIISYMPAIFICNLNILKI